MLVQLAGTWTAVRDDPIRRFCHPGSRLAAHSRVLASCAQVDRRGGALEDEELLGQRPWCGTLWIAVAPEPMIPTRFSTRPVRLPLLSPPL